MSVFFQSSCQTTVSFSNIDRTDKFVDNTALKFFLCAVFQVQKCVGVCSSVDGGEFAGTF